MNTYLKPSIKSLLNIQDSFDRISTKLKLHQVKEKEETKQGKRKKVATFVISDIIVINNFRFRYLDLVVIDPKTLRSDMC